MILYSIFCNKIYALSSIGSFNNLKKLVQKIIIFLGQRILFCKILRLRTIAFATYLSSATVQSLFFIKNLKEFPIKMVLGSNNFIYLTPTSSYKIKKERSQIPLFPTIILFYNQILCYNSQLFHLSLCFTKLVQAFLVLLYLSPTNTT